MSVSLGQLRTLVYNILREEEDTTAYPYNLVDLFINSSQQRICNGRVINPLTKEEVRKTQLPFLQTSAYYSNNQMTTLSADTTIGATTLNTGTTLNFPSSGVLYIAGDIITYTGTTATSFTGVSGVSFAFKSGTQISIAFTLPTDMQSIINITYNNRYRLPAKLYDDMFEELNKFKGYYNRNMEINSLYNNTTINPFYTIINGLYLVIFNANDNGGIIQLRYEKTATELTLESDTSIIDNDIYAKTTIPYLATGEMLFNRGEEARASQILNFGIGQVREMYSYYNNKNYESINGTHYRMAKGGYNI